MASKIFHLRDDLDGSILKMSVVLGTDIWFYPILSSIVMFIPKSALASDPLRRIGSGQDLWVMDLDGLGSFQINRFHTYPGVCVVSYVGQTILHIQISCSIFT